VNEIQLQSRIDKNVTHFAIASDYVNGSFNGNFKYSTIGFTINQIIQNYLPLWQLQPHIPLLRPILIT
jgi:hypothetical protein